MKLASIDFEYYDTAEKDLEIVCCSIRYDDATHNYWTHRGEGNSIEDLKADINKLHKDGYIFLSYSVVAEASAFLSIGLDPLLFRWIDLYLEYRHLSNHNHNYSYGAQLINGIIKTTNPPKSKWKRTEEEDREANYSKQEYGMGAAVYKTLGLVIDTDFKKASRDIIIACNSGKLEDIERLEKEKLSIMNYCASDVAHLEPMWAEFYEEYASLLGYEDEMDELSLGVKSRAEYACRTAMMERLGYPIDVGRTRNFSNQVGNILWEVQRDVSSQFSKDSDGDGIFRAKTKSRPLDLSWNQIHTRSLVKKWKDSNKYKGWTKTDGGADSLSIKAFSKPISYNHKYPRGNFLAQMQRYLKLKQGLNGFSPSTGKSKKKFWDNVGEDGRVRPYFGIYGAQSARSQPSATSFIPLKAAWMRSLICPQNGRAICGIDFASQEFLLAALLSGDSKMLEAYASGDVYLAFGKAIGYIPADATKTSHKRERDNCKAVVLGLSYDMSKYGLATDLSEKFGRKVSEEEAQEWIDKHKEAYSVFWQWKADMIIKYKTMGYLKLEDHWYLWGDNDNFRSTGNFPVQGMGSCIMRKAVQLAQDSGLDVIYTLHDALYIEFNVGDDKAIRTLAECMDKAFRFYFPKDVQDRATVRLDADIWSPSYPSEAKYYEDTYMGYILPIKQQQIYIDPRGVEEYDRFKQYFGKMDYSQEEF